MKKNSLSTTGLSLSQAQSISNLCNQRAREIDNTLSGINNCSKTVDTGKKTLITQVGKPIPKDVVNLLVEKAELHATQAFLMENIKAKDAMLKETKQLVADTSSVVYPVRVEPVRPVTLPEVTEEWGWEQLTVDEICKFQEAEAYASHIGQFIHKGSILDKLRIELPSIKTIEWMVIKDGEKTPVEVQTHHASTDLLLIHEQLATLHRKYEQDVNYYKAKVKNLVTIENARIAKINADAQHEAQQINNLNVRAFQTANQLVYEQVRSIQAEFEKERQAKIQTIASLRILVNPRFQDVVDLFLKALPTE